MAGLVGIDFGGGWIGRWWTVESKRHSGHGPMTRIATVNSTQRAAIGFGSGRYWRPTGVRHRNSHMMYREKAFCNSWMPWGRSARHHHKK